MKNLKYLFLAASLSWIPALLSSQTNENLRVVFQDAEYFLLSEDYEEALDAYLEIYKAEPRNANINYRIGLCYLNIPGQKSKSIPYLEYASGYVSHRYFESSFHEMNAPPQTYFLLGTAYQITNLFTKAKEAFNNYKHFLRVNDVYEIDFVDFQIAACDFAEEQIQQPLAIRKKKLNSIVQKNRANYNPVMSPKGDQLLYMTDEKFYNAIWMVNKRNGKWRKPVNITSHLGSDGNCYPTSMTGDGKTLYLIRTTNFGADIYISKYDGERWSKMKKIGRPVNSKYWETHASVSHDGNTLFFTSNRKNGYGGLDIYRSVKNKQGKYTDPVNLGPIINTKYNEETPFITENGRILFFASQGHEGMGGFDTYKSALQTSGKWSVPINLGYPVNTTDDNIFYFPVDNGERALYAGILDQQEAFYSIKELEVQKIPLNAGIAIQGRIELQDNRFPVDNSIMIEIINMENGDTIAQIKPDPKNLTFTQAISHGDFEFIVSGDGYHTERKNLNIPDDFQRKELSLNIELVPEQVSSGEYLVIKNILFDYNSHEISEAARIEIERLFQVMVKYPDLNIEVTGHADSKGPAGYNLKLSEKRAESVVNYLTSKGIDPIRFVARGLGEINNVAMNMNSDGSDNPEGRKFNRNVQIKILKPEHFNVMAEPIEVPDHLRPGNSMEYTILLCGHKFQLDQSYFGHLGSITQGEVEEKILDSVYMYTIGRFYSRTQAEEMLKNPSFKVFPNATIINSHNIQNYIPEIMAEERLGDEFGIQLYALRNRPDLSGFKNLPETYLFECHDGLFRVIHGKFNDKEKALRNLQELKNKGFTDAFVVNLSRLKLRNNYLAGLNLTDNANELFTIQIKALKTAVGKNYFENLDDIFVIDGQDGYFRYICGEYKNKDMAIRQLQQVKELGYSDAFIIPVEQIPGY